MIGEIRDVTDWYFNRKKMKKEVKVKKLPKQKTIPKLVKELDDVFSEYVRRVNIDEEGLVSCCTCPKKTEWKKIQCGHYISRKKMAVRWELKNTGPQCLSCNIFNQGEQVKFRLFLVKTYGESEVERIELKSHNKMKLERFTLSYLINEFKEKVKLLK